ncbi:hypothetical protein Salmuc_04465 [Salipiger mucosus DSM 16094]|uniref:Uncharacterized protein n=2 Tax=Salipiger mucosus TaxID=263378 RepID=S9QEZ3_9RHOB|nr:hypothetical protein Salmuc_04465 [Salipiger mucosus DSM 16094]
MENELASVAAQVDLLARSASTDDGEIDELLTNADAEREHLEILNDEAARINSDVQIRISALRSVLQGIVGSER